MRRTADARPTSSRSARGAATIAVVGALAFAGGLAALVAIHPVEYLRRAATLGDEDAGDRLVFAERAIPAGGAPLAFVDAKDAVRIDAIAAAAGHDVPLPALLESTGTLAFIVTKGDRLLDERYFGGQACDVCVTSQDGLEKLESGFDARTIDCARLGVWAAERWKADVG